jgi:single-strand DNA-binding protein
MASYNKVILVGNLTRDPELRYTPSSMAVTDLGLAVNDRRKGSNGEWIEEVTFVDVTLWGRTAEVASEYLKKGSNVLIEGRLKLDSWETNDGQKRSKLKVICERMQMLGARAAGGGGGGRGAQHDDADFGGPPDNFGESNVPAARSQKSRPPDDDIPF